MRQGSRVTAPICRPCPFPRFVFSPLEQCPVVVGKMAHAIPAATMVHTAAATRTPTQSQARRRTTAGCFILIAWSVWAATTCSSHSAVGPVVNVVACASRRWDVARSLSATESHHRISSTSKSSSRIIDDSSCRSPQLPPLTSPGEPTQTRTLSQDGNGKSSNDCALRPAPLGFTWDLGT